MTTAENLKNASPRTILAVDDEEEILRLYNTFLKFSGFIVKTVQNAEDCVDHLMHHEVDLILLDVNMPGIDGLRLLEMIRTQPKNKETPIIMISARGDEGTVKKAATLGCDNFIVKPFTLTELAERIKNELFEINYDQVRKVLEVTRNMRTRLLREAGLQEFRIVDWDPYSINYGGRELCVLTPRGVRPNGLAKLDEADLQKRIIIFLKSPIRWKRIWPLER